MKSRIKFGNKPGIKSVTSDNQFDLIFQKIARQIKMSTLETQTKSRPLPLNRKHICTRKSNRLIKWICIGNTPCTKKNQRDTDSFTQSAKVIQLKKKEVKQIQIEKKWPNSNVQQVAHAHGQGNCHCTSRDRRSAELGRAGLPAAEEKAGAGPGQCRGGHRSRVNRSLEWNYGSDYAPAGLRGNGTAHDWSPEAQQYTKIINMDLIPSTVRQILIGDVKPD
jgi:hypothetical protein